MAQGKQDFYVECWLSISIEKEVASLAFIRKKATASCLFCPVLSCLREHKDLLQKEPLACQVHGRVRNPSHSEKLPPLLVSCSSASVRQSISHSLSPPHLPTLPSRVHQVLTAHQIPHSYRPHHPQIQHPIKPPPPPCQPRNNKPSYRTSHTHANADVDLPRFVVVEVDPALRDSCSRGECEKGEDEALVKRYWSMSD